MGHQNTGHWNTGHLNTGHLNTDSPNKHRVFNKWVTSEKFGKIEFPDFFYFDLTLWISHDSATQEEKVKYQKEIECCGGFLKSIPYKEAWQLSYDKASPEDKAKVKKIPGFNAKLFEEISGIKT
jgi:hypothetical protein